MQQDTMDRADTAAELPDVVQRGLRREWPETLRGPEIVDIIILIECGVSVDHFAMWREDEIDNANWEEYLDPQYVARLETLTISEVIEPEGGCAEQAHAEYYATLITKAPPIVLNGRKLLDGNHRLEAARLRSETHIDAYVISQI